MSAFVVDSNIMSKVVRAICVPGRYGYRGTDFMGIKIDHNDRAVMTKIGRVLFSLNIDSVTQRYPDVLDKPDHMPGGDIMIENAFTFTAQPVFKDLADKVACYKAMECLAYQSCEGDAIKSANYAELARHMALFAAHIIQEMPEYQAAPWSR